LCIDGTRRRSIGLRTENASFEECFDLAKLLGDHGTELLLMRSDLQCRLGADIPTDAARSRIEVAS
jgi:hypothetical protein